MSINRAQIKLTQAFIDTMPIYVKLIPRKRVETPGGGWKWEEQPPRPKQKLRLIEYAISEEPVRSDDGEWSQVNYQLLGMPTACMALGDYFYCNGARYEIMKIWPELPWEKRAGLYRFG